MKKQVIIELETYEITRTLADLPNLGGKGRLRLIHEEMECQRLYLDVDDSFNLSYKGESVGKFTIKSIIGGD